jgi:hypothetical protein
MAVGSVIAFIVWGVGRKLLIVRGVVRDGEAGPVAKLVLFAVFFVFALSLMALALHAFIAGQGSIGNGEVRMVRLLREHEMGAILLFWGFLTIGLLVALPVMWTDFFGFTPAIGRSQGRLVANVGMTLEAVAARSSLPLTLSEPNALTRSRRSVGDGVFDFEVAGSGLRFESCRYYWLETGDHDEPAIVHLNVGISPRKQPRSALAAERATVIARLKDAGWNAGHFEYSDPALVTLHGGTREGDGSYWAHDDTLLIIRGKRVDESKRDEDPAVAGEFILYVELVPRRSSNYERLIFDPPAANRGAR